jgi:tRNA threonylcarbamoyladenosine biosynthesis protein TsaE
MVQALSIPNGGDKTHPMAHPGSLLFELTLMDEAETGRVAGKLARILKAGDIIALSGDLGAGKTAMARAMINALPGAPEDVPSPTFTLVQTYNRGELELWHVDLYRLEDPEESLELGLEDAFVDAACLIEWPDRLGPYLPRGHLRVTLSHQGNESMRHLKIDGDAAWAERLQSMFDAESGNE